MQLVILLRTPPVPVPGSARDTRAAVEEIRAVVAAAGSKLLPTPDGGKNADTPVYLFVEVDDRATAEELAHGLRQRSDVEAAYLKPDAEPPASLP